MVVIDFKKVMVGYQEWCYYEYWWRNKSHQVYCIIKDIYDVVVANNRTSSDLINNFSIIIGLH